MSDTLTPTTSSNHSPSVRTRLGKRNIEILEKKFLPIRILLLCAKEFGGGEGCILNGMERAIVDIIIKETTCHNDNYLMDVENALNEISLIHLHSKSQDKDMLSLVRTKMDIINPMLHCPHQEVDIIEFLIQFHTYDDPLNLLLENHDYTVDFSKRKNALSKCLLSQQDIIAKLIQKTWINHDNINVYLLEGLLFSTGDKMLDKIFCRIHEEGFILDMNQPRFDDGGSIVDFCIKRRGLFNMKTLRKYGGRVKLSHVPILTNKYIARSLEFYKIVNPHKAKLRQDKILKKRKVELAKELTLAKEFCPESIPYGLPYEILKEILGEWEKDDLNTLESMYNNFCYALGILTNAEDKIDMLKDLLTDMKDKGFDPEFVPISALQPIFFILFFRHEYKEVLIRMCELWSIKFDVEVFSTIDINTYAKRSECLEILAYLKEKGLILNGVKSIYNEYMLQNLCGLLIMTYVIQLDLVEKDFRFKNGHSLVDMCIIENHLDEAIDMVKMGVKPDGKTYKLIRSMPNAKDSQFYHSLFINIDRGE